MENKRLSKLARAMQNEETETQTQTPPQTEAEQTNILNETISEHKNTLFDVDTNNKNSNAISTNANGNVSNNGNNPIVDTQKTVAEAKKRGRPRKADTNIQASNNTQQTNGKTENKTDFFGEYKSEANSANAITTQTGGAQSEVIKNYFTGLLVLTLIDAIAPAGITFLLKKNDPTKKINPNSLKLTDDEMKSLEPLADEVIKLYIGTLDPLSAFVISVIIIYGAKVAPHLY